MDIKLPEEPEPEAEKVKEDGEGDAAVSAAEPAELNSEVCQKTYIFFSIPWSYEGTFSYIERIERFISHLSVSVSVYQINRYQSRIHSIFII